ncbi:MAG: zinc metallopeptidase [bacterium]
MFFDSTFFLLIPVMILAMWSQHKIKKNYSKYAKIKTQKGLTGQEIAKIILKKYGINNVSVESIHGEMTDHYDSRDRTIRLSSNVFNNSSIAALSIAAHEAGHAIQHHKLYFPLQIRNAIVPVANLGSNLAFPLFFIGFFFLHNKFLMDLGILIYFGAVVFSFITLPVEVNASQRALKILEQEEILVNNEILGAKQMLSAAGLTYFAATAMAVMQLVRMLILRDRNN